MWGLGIPGQIADERYPIEAEHDDRGNRTEDDEERPGHRGDEAADQQQADERSRPDEQGVRLHVTVGHAAQEAGGR